MAIAPKGSAARAQGSGAKRTNMPDPRLPAKASIEETRKREAARQAANRGYPEVELLSELFDQEIDHRIDVANDDSLDPYSAPDPANAAIDRVRKPGMSYKLLSPRCCDVLGMRGYELSRDADGKEIRVGNMMLGEIPERVADKRHAAALRQSEEEVGLISDDYRASVERLKSAATGMGLRVLDRGEEVNAEMSTHQETLGDRRGAGVQIRRGSQSESY